MRARPDRLASLALVMALAGCAAGDKENPPVLLEVPDDPTITFKLWFAAGSQDDPKGREGLAYLTGQMIAEASTTENSYEQILERLYPLAASYGVRVDREMTVLTGRTHRDNLDRFLELFEDAWLRPAFDESDFQRIKTDSLNRVRNTLRYESDEELAKAALAAFIFEGTRYAHPIGGTVRGLEAATIHDVREFYRRHYGSPRIGLGGGFDAALPRRFRAAVSERAAIQPPAVPPIEPAAIEGRRVMLVSKPGADASISLGFPIDVRRGEREFYALWVANSWLGEHRNSASHLFQVIREQRGLNYGDYSYIEAFPDGGRRQFPPEHVGRRQQLFEIWIRTLPNAQAQFALRAAVRELERLVERGMSDEDFELTRSFLRKYVLHFAETTSSRLGYAIDDGFYGLEGEGHLARFRRVLDELTLDEVNAAVRRHLTPDRLKIAIVTGDAAGLGAALASDAPSPLTYPTAKGEAILAEDALIENHPLGIAPDGILTVPVERIFEE